MHDKGTKISGVLLQPDGTHVCCNQIIGETHWKSDIGEPTTKMMDGKREREREELNERGEADDGLHQATANGQGPDENNACSPQNENPFALSPD